MELLQALQNKPLKTIKFKEKIVWEKQRGGTYKSICQQVNGTIISWINIKLVNTPFIIRKSWINKKPLQVDQEHNGQGKKKQHKEISPNPKSTKQNEEKPKEEWVVENLLKQHDPQDQPLEKH